MPFLEDNCAYEEKCMRGCWPSDEEIRLHPGVDFDLPGEDSLGHEIDYGRYMAPQDRLRYEELMYGWADSESE
jgi:hypothetical protein